MQVPSDTHKKPITSITAVLLPSVTYLLTLPRTYLLTYSLTVWSLKKLGLLWRQMHVLLSAYRSLCFLKYNVIQDKDVILTPNSNT
jgi:hypothetical protein